MKWIFLFIYTSLAWAQTDYGMIINGPGDKSSYYDVFDRTTMKFYRTMGLSGIYRDKIMIMNSDGRSPFGNTNVSDRPALIAGVAKEHQHADGMASKVDLKAKFTELSKKMKAGDHLHLYLTGHGSSVDGKVSFMLWGEKLSMDQLRSYLKLLPSGVTKHIVGNFCFSGALMELTTEPNTCVFSSVDEKTTMKALTTKDEYSEYFMDELTKGTAYYDAHKSAEFNDKRNGNGLNSLDWYIQHHPPKGNYACDEISDSAKLLRSSMSALASKTFPYQAYLIYFKKYKEEVEKAVKEFDALTPAEQNAKRGYFTKLIEGMKQNLNMVQVNQKTRYLQNMAREQEFIEKATPAQLKKYLSIKACVNYAIKH